MDILLNQHEIRVLGCLIEKSMITPDNYPLSLNSLTAACNQKSNRNPVVEYDQEIIVRAIDLLKSKQLVVQGDSSRVPKYSETIVSLKNILNKEASILMILMVRGPQTIGEIRSRTERSYNFDNVIEVQESIDDLIEQGYLIKLPKQPGRKEPRYCHLFSGEPEVEETNIQLEPATLRVREENERVEKLSEEVENLRKELELFKKDFLEFKSQFD